MKVLLLGLASLLATGCASQSKHPDPGPRTPAYSQRSVAAIPSPQREILGCYQREFNRAHFNAPANRDQVVQKFTVALINIDGVTYQQIWIDTARPVQNSRSFATYNFGRCELVGGHESAYRNECRFGVDDSANSEDASLGATSHFETRLDSRSRNYLNITAPLELNNYREGMTGAPVTVVLQPGQLDGVYSLGSVGIRVCQRLLNW